MMSTSYFGSLWGKKEAPSESDALASMREALAGELGALAARLPADDGVAAAFREGGRALDDCLLRYLRSNGLDVGRAAAQLRSFVQWRAARGVGCMGAGAMRGAAGGCPVVLVPELGAGRTTLLFTSAAHYVKRAVTPEAHERAVIRIFEALLYAADGVRATAAVAVVDFDGVSVAQVDVAAMRRDVALFMSFYPETFHKMLFVGYPKFIYSFWRMVKPLLDERTQRRVHWCEARADVAAALGEYFQRHQIPVWLGGDSSRWPVDVLCGVEDAQALERQLIDKYAPASA